MNGRVAVPHGLLQALRLSHFSNPHHPITTLHCFDFDGTLIHTPGPDVGKKRYYKYTGRRWPYRGWWGRIESLQPPVVPDPLPSSLVIHNVYKEWRRIRAGAVEGTAGFVATGRRAMFHDVVVKILSSCKNWNDDCGVTSSGDAERGLELGEGWENGVCCYPGLKISVDEWKMRLVVEVVKQLGGIRLVHVWEDRADHAKTFENVLGERLDGMGVRLIVNRVVPA